jgi:hypothetical protein
MGNFMIPVCCVCGKSSPKWHDSKWEDDGGLQDFCPEHANLIRKQCGDFIEYIVSHMAEGKANQRIHADDLPYWP